MTFLKTDTTKQAHLDTIYNQTWDVMTFVVKIDSLGCESVIRSIESVLENIVYM